MPSLFPLGWDHYFAGGLLIGLGVSLLFILTGWIGGMSSVFTSTWSFVSRWSFFQQARFVETRHWRFVFSAGLVLGGAGLSSFSGLWPVAGQGWRRMCHFAGVPVGSAPIGSPAVGRQLCHSPVTHGPRHPVGRRHFWSRMGIQWCLPWTGHCRGRLPTGLVERLPVTRPNQCKVSPTFNPT
jgi:hypothetical protein